MRRNICALRGLSRKLMTLLVVVALPASHAAAQNINNGKLLYSTPLVTGQLSCSAGACHSPNPLGNQNKVLLAANNPGAIGIGINSVQQMAFLKNNVTGTQLQDIAAYINNPGAATTPTPAIAATPSSLDFGSVSAGSLSGALTVTVGSVGTAPLTLTSLAIAGSNFAVIGGTCAVGTAIGVNGSCTIVARFAPDAAGVQTGTLTLNHNASGPPVTVSLSGTGVALTSTTTKTMVEYLYVPLNYFFITSRDSDKLLLDTVAAFQRTGQSFSVLAAREGDAKSITRFFFDKVAVQASRGSHFYTLIDEEKTLLAAANPTNAATAGLPLNEGVDSWAFLPLVTGPGGSCPSGQTPVFRLFRGNVRFPDDPNHRFTVSTSIYNEYVALGWDGEGVRFCVPSP